MEKTEERKLFSDKVSDWVGNHKKKIWLSVFAIYIIFVIIFAIITINMNGGIQTTLHLMNDYPEQKYQQLEKEMKNIVVEGDGIYPEELSNAYIKYDISYKERSNSEGKYTITLTDEVTITGTIGKDFNKEDLIIEREYKTESDYRKQQYVSTITGIVLIPIFPILFIVLIITVIFFIIGLIEFLIEFLVKWYNSRKTAKK